MRTPASDGGRLLERVPVTDCAPRADGDAGVADLVKADFLHEPGVLDTLATRYARDAVYTYSGQVSPLVYFFLLQLA